MSDSKYFEYKQVFDHAQVGMALVSLQGEWLEVNPQFCAMTGYSRNELLGVNPQVLSHPDDREVDGYFLQGLLTGKDDTTLQKRCIHKDGHTIWMRVSASVVCGRQEDERPVILTANNITGLIEAQEALQSASARLHSALSATCTGIWEWNILSGDLFWTDNIDTIFGFESGLFQRTYEAFLDCVYPEDRDIVTDAVHAAINHKKKYHIEHRIVWPDGSVRWMLEDGKVYFNEEDTPIKMVGVVQDITQRKDAERNRLSK